jgi:hypothetical protein
MNATDVAIFTVTVAYTGVSAAKIIVTDVLPAKLVPAANVAPSVTPPGSYDPVTGDWTLTLNDGATETLKIPVQAAANANGCATNTATGRFVDPNFTNTDASGDQASQTIAVIGGCADLSASITISDRNVVGCLLGSTGEFDVVWTASITNNGPTDATGVVGNVLTNSPTDQRSFDDPIGPFGPVSIAVGETKIVREISEITDCDGSDFTASGTINITGATTADPDPSNNSDSTSMTVVRSDPTVSGASGSTCFIATAAYGSYLDPHVATLRTFRDNWLLTHAPGRSFVAWYYRNSPALAGVIAESEALRVMTRLALTPLILSIKHPVVTGCLLFCVIVIPIGWRRRIRG